MLRKTMFNFGLLYQAKVKLLREVYNNNCYFTISLGEFLVQGSAAC